MSKKKLLEEKQKKLDAALVQYMDRKQYPNVEVSFFIVDKFEAHIKLSSFIHEGNGGRFEVVEKCIYKYVDTVDLSLFIIKFTNRFHIMCQKYKEQCR